MRQYERPSALGLGCTTFGCALISSIVRSSKSPMYPLHDVRNKLMSAKSLCQEGPCKGTLTDSIRETTHT